MFYKEECFQAKAAQHKVAKRIGTHLISISHGSSSVFVEPCLFYLRPMVRSRERKQKKQRTKKKKKKKKKKKRNKQVLV